MKYFNENKQIIKAQQGLEVFLRPEPVIDNTGGLGAGVVHNQRVVKKQQVKEEKSKQQIEEAKRPRAYLNADKDPRSYDQREKDARRQQLQQNINEQRNNLYSIGRPNTEATRAAVEVTPYVAEATKQYFSRPTKEIVSGELNTLNHMLNPFMMTDDMFQAAREQSRQGHPLRAMGLGFTGFGLGALAATPVKTPITAGVNATKRAAQGVKQATKAATENIGARMNAAVEGFNSYIPTPAYQPIFTDGTISFMPWNNNQMNYLGGLGQRINNAWKGFRTKPTTATESTAAETAAESAAKSTATDIENETLADIRYGGNNRNKRVKVFAPGKTKTISTIDGKTIDPSTLTIETKPTVDGHIVEEIVPGQEVSSQKWFMYEGRYRPETDIKKNTVTTPKTRVKFGEEVPEGSEFLNIKTGKLEPLEGKIFRTPQGWGRKSYIYYDGTPVQRYKNLGFYKQVGLPIAASIILFGRKNVQNKSKDAGKSIIFGDGILGSIIKQNNSQQTTPTTQTPEQTNNTFDAFNAADSTNLEEMRKEMEQLGY